MATPIVKKYFQSNQSFLFQWADQGRELCWLDGTTIAFHEELCVALQRLASGSLPGFSAVVLALAAMRQTWPDVAERITRLVRALQTSQMPSYADAMRKHKYLADTWPVTAGKLTLLSRYVQEHAGNAAARAELLGGLFDHLESGYTADEQKTIAAAFADGLPASWVAERRGDGEPMTLPSNDQEEEMWRHRPPMFHRVLHDVLDLLQVARLLASGLHDYSADDLHQRVQTGVAEEVVAPDQDLLDKPLAPGQVLEALHDDPELSGFARLTRHLIAAVSLPRAISSAQDVRSGGISDISNRGRLDQLLLSELAFDDLTLAVRIASNEAMYLRHEPPPGPQVERRPVLIDTSLPMWGIPKLYATAMALALQAGADERLSVDCFRPQGSDVEPVALMSREQISEHLATLSPAEHAGAALSAFEDRIQKTDAAAEPVLITSSDTLASHTFRFALNQTALKRLWIIAVERDGRLTVLQRTRQGTSVHKSLHLPLHDILQGPASAVRRKHVPDNLPVILGRTDFPLRLFHQIRAGRVFLWGDDVISLADDGRLMFWDKPAQGACQVCDDLPNRSTCAVHLVDRDASAILFYLAGETSELVNVKRGIPDLRVDRIPVEDGLDKVTDVRRHDHTILLFGTRPDGGSHCTAIDAQTGRTLAGESLNPAWQRKGRCIRRDGQWGVLSCTGPALNFTALPDSCQSAVDLLELRTGNFVALTERGELTDPLDATRLFPVEHHGDRDGLALGGYLPGSDRFCLQSGTQGTLVQTVDKSCIPFVPKQKAIEHLELGAAARQIRNRTPHWKFRHIAVTRQHRLCLQNARGEIFVIQMQGSKIMLSPTGMSPNLPPDICFSFQPCPGPANVGYRFSLAEWPNGQAAWLDSRGLLHLKNANPAYSEVTMVLRDGELSGWLSSGESFGEDYYCGESPDGVLPQEAQGSGAEQDTAIHFVRQNQPRRCTPEYAWETAIKPFLGSAPWTFQYNSSTADGRNIVLPES